MGAAGEVRARGVPPSSATISMPLVPAGGSPARAKATWRLSGVQVICDAGAPRSQLVSIRAARIAASGRDAPPSGETTWTSGVSPTRPRR